MLTYRPATAADAEAVMTFWATAAEDSHRPPDSTDAVLRLITRDPEALILAIDNEPVSDGVSDGLIVGSIIVGWDGWRCHLYRLAVAPTHRRRGIARTLITLAEDRFTSYGGTRADAMVLDDNADAHPTWTAAGYTPQPNWSRWTKPL
ncbi:MAG TPA: GNAT family N-acetyltransferase [Kribbella sp.]|uniref:GNAT family N-acetyltransferase n=1 Tax=Kribbella sp. TaxID=1871183 RepID=UPI002D78EE01|nr:GNAT family N-acetyltransferase [Kribbella sp.]HET6296861.1 GNAT family N-acetyltransferase [Kribbella sp.]